MKITERISSAVTQLKTSAANKLSTIGKAFGMSARVVSSTSSSKVGIYSTPMLVPTVKRLKETRALIPNMSIKFNPDAQTTYTDGYVSRYDIRTTHNTTGLNFTEGEGAVTDHLCCRHMVAMELARREAEKTHPTIHTKADRAKTFSLKNAAHLATQRQYLERRYYDAALYTNDVHLFDNDNMGMFLESEFKKLSVGESKNFTFITVDHAMALTIKRKEDSYSVSAWDPNFTADHTKIKFNTPNEAAVVCVENLLGHEHTAIYSAKNPLFFAFDLPEGWTDDVPKLMPKLTAHSYERGLHITDTEVRAEWMKKFTSLA